MTEQYTIDRKEWRVPLGAKCDEAWAAFRAVFSDAQQALPQWARRNPDQHHLEECPAINARMTEIMRAQSSGTNGQVETQNGALVARLWINSRRPIEDNKLCA